MSIRNVRGKSEISKDLGFLVELFRILIASVVFFREFFDGGIACDFVFEVFHNFLQAQIGVLVHEFRLMFETGNEVIFFLFLFCSEIFDGKWFCSNGDEPELLKLLALS
jgi:hypothetical protein